MEHHESKERDGMSTEIWPKKGQHFVDKQELEYTAWCCGGKCVIRTMIGRKVGCNNMFTSHIRSWCYCSEAGSLDWRWGDFRMVLNTQIKLLQIKLRAWWNANLKRRWWWKRSITQLAMIWFDMTIKWTNSIKSQVHKVDQSYRYRVREDFISCDSEMVFDTETTYSAWHQLSKLSH